MATERELTVLFSGGCTDLAQQSVSHVAWCSFVCADVTTFSSRSTPSLLIESAAVVVTRGAKCEGTVRYRHQCVDGVVFKSHQTQQIGCEYADQCVCVCVCSAEILCSSFMSISSQFYYSIIYEYHSNYDQTECTCVGVVLGDNCDMESVMSAGTQKVSTERFLLASDLSNLLHYCLDMSRDMVSGDTPERAVMDSIIKVCCKGLLCKGL